MQLTRDVRAGTELRSHLRVHGDHHFFLLAHDCIPLLDLVIDPLSEKVTQDLGANIHDPLLGRLRQVDVVGKVVGDVRLVFDEHQDPLEGEVLILRYEDRWDVFVDQVALPLVNQVIHEVDGDVV